MRRRAVLIVIAANTLFWVYFWTSFAFAAESHDPRPWGHYPVDEHTFWGHSIGLTQSTALYPFMRVAEWVQFPSFVVVVAFEKMVLGDVGASATLLGISIMGWRLLVVMGLSFLQWYLIALVLRRVWTRTSRESSIPPHVRGGQYIK